ncbi:hypothetical protein ABT023_26470 [Micromonospora sp. NPDC002296]|uniref:hypothetical protein n=1 Tax=Micromonospora sp. NPDC002296 TaxID=3154271 RepID=UPI00332ED285
MSPRAAGRYLLHRTARRRIGVALANSLVRVRAAPVTAVTGAAGPRENGVKKRPVAVMVA